MLVSEFWEWKTYEYTQETQSPGEKKKKNHHLSVAKELFIDKSTKEVGVGM